MCSNNPGCTGNVTTHVTSWAYCTARVYDASSARNYVGIRPSRTCQAAFAKTWWEECDRLLLPSDENRVDANSRSAQCKVRMSTQTSHKCGRMGGS
ncbi:uncharacterized protein FMAN_08416 [Fusarium mangiferae]|uniref:Uncharacterized protein n=1 Tax=Fusarium mangiferae TaxID=192010 RepID=A0A1L7TT23_FUSMA|nr:uncharacterized protein FMAN_08416 [Fusarium mangiferae]CVK98825.1 uncharacterized protein FMAN_08416 [Fusarium mangiferae]